MAGGSCRRITLLRLRRLRLRTCPPPPARAASLPGRAPSLVSRSASVYSFAAAAPAAGACAGALRRSIAPPWSASALASQRCAGASLERRFSCVAVARSSHRCRVTRHHAHDAGRSYWRRLLVTGSSSLGAISVRDGRLYVERCDVTELAQRHGTPCYVVSEAQLRRMPKDHGGVRRRVAARPGGGPASVQGCAVAGRSRGPERRRSRVRCVRRLSCARRWGSACRASASRSMDRARTSPRSPPRSRRARRSRSTALRSSRPCARRPRLSTVPCAFTCGCVPTMRASPHRRTSRRRPNRWRRWRTRTSRGWRPSRLSGWPPGSSPSRASS